MPLSPMTIHMSFWKFFYYKAEHPHFSYFSSVKPMEEGHWWQPSRDSCRELFFLPCELTGLAAGKGCSNLNVLAQLWELERSMGRNLTVLLIPGWNSHPFLPPVSAGLQLEEMPGGLRAHLVRCPFKSRRNFAWFHTHTQIYMPQCLAGGDIGLGWFEDGQRKRRRWACLKESDHSPARDLGSSC